MHKVERMQGDIKIKACFLLHKSIFVSSSVFLTAAPTMSPADVIFDLYIRALLLRPGPNDVAPAKFTHSR